MVTITTKAPRLIPAAQLAAEDAPTTHSPAEIQAMREMLESVIAREKVIKTEWHDKTKDVFDIYEGGKDEETPFNILYSNTEILVPNLFSAAPRPVVKRRFGEQRADTPAKAAERMAEYLMDTNISGYPEFVDGMEAAVLAAALPGQGQCRVRIVEGVPVLDYVQHDQFIWGYAKRWEDVPWIAYRHDKTQKDIVAEFEVPEEIAARIVKVETTPEDKNKGPATMALYEVWNKADGMVYFLCEAFPDVCIQKLEDPLKIAGFFPSGRPLRLLSTPISTMPRSMYGLYKQQALELNVLTQRIRKVARAIQVRGIYDGNLPEMENLFDSGDAENKMSAASNPGGMARDGGLDKHIWFMPIDKLILVLKELFMAREQVKSTIYEILGIGDILRGVSAASETASAQQIKDKWGSLRIKKARGKVNVFVRWHIRTMIELAADHTPEDIWSKVTGMKLQSSQEAAIAKMQPATPMPGQPPAPPPENWGDVLGALRSDFVRSYLIDIETNSTVDSDATEDKAEVTDFMNALGQSITAVEGLASQGPTGHVAAQQLLVEICKRFRMGSEMQVAIMGIQPKPPGQDPETQKAQEEVKAAQEKVKAEQQALEQAKMQAQVTAQQQADQIRQQAQAAEDAFRGHKTELEDMQARIKEMMSDMKVEKAELDIKSAEIALQLKSVQTAQSAAVTAVKAAKTPPKPAAPAK